MTQFKGCNYGGGGCVVINACREVRGGMSLLQYMQKIRSDVRT